MSTCFLSSVLQHLIWRPTRVVILLLLSSFVLASPVPSSFVQAAPVPPALISPANGTTADVTNYPPVAIPYFEWSSVPGATAYNLQISSDIAFTTVAVNITTPHTQFTPTNESLSDGLWYWRVRVSAPTASDFQSASFSFTKQWASGSNRPVLTSPSEGASLEFYDATVFTWQPVTGTASYIFQIAATPSGFSSPTFSETTRAFSDRPPAKLANGTYYWRVVPVDAWGRNGTPSAVRSFVATYNQIPVQLQPVDGSSPTFTPTFSWTAVRGAQFYRLQYSTDPSFNANVTVIDTNNTTYTPTTTLPNDVNYWWRVRAFSGNSVGDWSPSWSFTKKWYLQTTLLTPTNNSQYVSEPFFSWTPVPGARAYQIDVSRYVTFSPMEFSDTTVNPFYVRPNQSWEALPAPYTWYWRVTPIDGSGNVGLASAPFSFVNPPTPPLVPRLEYPFFYYAPVSSLSVSPQVGFRPREDRTVPVPNFMWHRLFTTSTPITEVVAYRLQVSTDPLFWSVNWSYDTENQSASPTSTSQFTPTPGGIYYWRVRPLDGVNGNTIGNWSQVWQTRIDPNLLTNATSGMVKLLRPTYKYEMGSEVVETTPMFEWLPTTGADSYDIEISTGDGADFGTHIVASANVPYPVYTPPTRLVYDGNMPYGTFYWRVRARQGVATLATSDTWRFQIAAQSHWKEPRTVGGNRLKIAADPVGDMTDTTYNLQDLYAAQAKDYWYFGFKATPSQTVTLGLYLDLDHVNDSGATSDARGFHVTTVPAHRPEYAIYFAAPSGSFSADYTVIYPWSNGAWGTPQSLSSIGGLFSYNPIDNYVEIGVPNTSIGMGVTTGSIALSLFSVPAAGGHAQDTVPSDPNVNYGVPDFTPGVTSILSRFASVSERLTMELPPSNTSLNDPVDFSYVPPFEWQTSVDASWVGYQLEVHRDAQYTSPVLQYSVCCSTLIPPDFTNNTGDLWGDNTYYWRVQPIYNAPNNPHGAWSYPTAFDRKGFVLESLSLNPTGHMTTTITLATPTFVWDMVEGAQSYDLQVDDDPGFNSINVSANTTQTSFTPPGTLDERQYYWRVRAVRSGSTNDWSPSKSFVLGLPQPTGLTPSGAVVHRAPTFCWDTLIATSGGSPVLAAWKYRIQVSNNDPTFSSIYDQIDTEQSCWTPIKGYVEGTLYWRVAMMDGQGRLGSYTPAVTITKQYPTTTLVSPSSGSMSSSTPIFIWTPVDGAAQYRLQVSTSDIFSTIYHEVTTKGTRYLPPKVFASQSYYWRVAMVDQDGIVGPYNTATIIVGGLTGGNNLYLPFIRKP